MKKFISTLAASVLAVSSIPAISPINTHAVEYGNQDLYELAVSLGAETDYLNVPYIKETVSGYKEIHEYTDKSFGIAVLEMLVHNQKLDINEIKDNAGSMNEITDFSSGQKALEKQRNKRRRN